ncbi:MAG: hypothetical protein JNL83_00805 [Myxococcales bacterium]|nr:hypothetical protein [Myxococcales bacterium]
MRALFAILTVVCGARAAVAGEARGSSETLVGWSEDGTRYAVSGFSTNGPQGGEFFLEVRENGKAVYHWKQPEDPDSLSPDRIDVETWAPVKKFALKRLDGAKARKRFATQLVAVSTTRMNDRYTCGAGGWSLKKKAGAASLFAQTAAKGRCFRVMAGYINGGGTHALVKVREAWVVPAQAERITEEHDRFVLVRL